MKKYIAMIGLSISFCGGIEITITDTTKTTPTAVKTTPTTASLVKIQTPEQFFDVTNKILGFFYNQYQLRRLVEFRVLLDNICTLKPTMHTVNGIIIELAMPEHLETVELGNKERFFRIIQDSEANCISSLVSTQVLKMFQMLYLRFTEARKLGNRFIVFYSFLDV